MKAYIEVPRGLRLVPENEREAAILDEWSMQKPHVENIQKKMEGSVSALNLTFTNG